MLRALPLVLLLAVAAVLGGCRESVVAPEVPLDADPPVTVSTMYIKTPTALQVGSFAPLRAEDIPAAATYTWGLDGEGAVSAQANDPEGRDRILSVRGLREGTVTIYATARAADGTLLASASRQFEVVPR